MGEDSNQATEELYHSLGATVGLSELYIVPVDMQPDKVDPLSAKYGAPLKSFDDRIVGKTAGSKVRQRDSDEVAEVETYEYRAMRHQLDWFVKKYPTEAQVQKLVYPIQYSREVITCDNSNYSSEHPDNWTRSGIVVSVPYYGLDGRLQGCVSGVILTSQLIQALPTPEYGVINSETGFQESFRESGPFRKALSEGRGDRPDDSLVYSQILPVRVAGAMSPWWLWVGRRDTGFTTRPDVVAANQFHWVAGLMVALVSLITVSFIGFASSSRKKLEEVNKGLEREIVTRTSDLVHARKMQAVGELAAGVAHEINTPVQFIGDNLRFLETVSERYTRILERMAGALEDATTDSLQPADAKMVLADAHRMRLGEMLHEVPEAVQESLDGIRRISEIVKAMRDFAHPGVTGRVMANLNQIIESSTIVARHEWKSVADVRMDLLPSLPMVPCNPGEVGQVIVNLVVNSAHAIKERVGNTNEKGLIEIRSAMGGDHVAITITDNGNGIPEDLREKVFEQFFTTKGVGVGTGMGLAITRNVVERHGGTIEFSSVLGKGTEFTIALPVSVPLELGESDPLEDAA